MSQYTPVILSGYLNKKGDFNRHWKKRWFALRPKCLYYYIDHSSREVKGKIPLEQATLQRKSSTKRVNGFQIHTFIKVKNKKNQGEVTGGRVFFLEALDEAEKNEWCDALQDQMSVYSMQKLQDDYNTMKEKFNRVSKTLELNKNVILKHQQELKKKDTEIFELQTNLRIRSQSSAELRDEMKAYQNIKAQHEIVMKTKQDQINKLQKENQKLLDEKKRTQIEVQDIRAEFDHAIGQHKIQIDEYKRLLVKSEDEMSTTRRRMESAINQDKIKVQKSFDLERQRMQSELGKKDDTASNLIAQNEKEQQELYAQKEKELEDLFEELAQEKDAALREVASWTKKFTDLQLKFEKQKLKDKGRVLQLEQTVADTIEQAEIWKLKAETEEKEKTEILLTQRAKESRKESIEETNYYQMNSQIIMKDLEITRLKEEINQLRKGKMKSPTKSKHKNQSSSKKPVSPHDNKSKKSFIVSKLPNRN